MNLYKRSQLKRLGVVVEGVVQTAALSCIKSPLHCARATDELEVAYQDKAGHRQIRTIYARSHTYSEGQAIKVAYMPTSPDDAELAPGEPGDNNGIVFHMTLGTIITLSSMLVLIVKWTRRLRSNWNVVNGMLAQRKRGDGCRREAAVGWWCWSVREKPPPRLAL